jgi:hypothetical protein
MLQQLSHLILVAVFGVTLTSCKSKNEPALKPGEISETQKVELKKKAVENYKKLVEKYPESPHAEQAKERIQALGGAATPKK